MEIQNISSGSYIAQSGMKAASQTKQSSETKGTSAAAIQEQSDETADKTKQEDLKKELMKITEDLNKEMNLLNINVKFGFEDKIGEMFVSVYEKDSNKLLRKIPSDEALALMIKMQEIIGIIFNKKA